MIKIESVPLEFEFGSERVGILIPGSILDSGSILDGPDWTPFESGFRRNFLMLTLYLLKFCGI